MDRVTGYRDLIKAFINRVVELIKQNPMSGVDSLAVFDDERGHYMLVKTGWHDRKRIRAVTLFVRLQDGKIRIEEDWTENGIATELLKAGVPKEDIVLAFHPPELRYQTEFAST